MNSTRGRGSDDSGATARRSNKAALQMSDKLHGLSRRYDKLSLSDIKLTHYSLFVISSGILFLD
jgi:hypothetical protein